MNDFDTDLRRWMFRTFTPVILVLVVVALTVSFIVGLRIGRSHNPCLDRTVTIQHEVAR